MDVTPLLHKPVVYGSGVTNALFRGLLVLHILPAATAPVAGVVAMLAKKGSARHLHAGKIFLW